ncbi:MAG: alpha/beta hydrolase domain-containing protein [bacterium]|nr:hypothetical protein [Gammaproteobacteria bacterium]HIL97358.1 hypothetical protein [Pseudomonadales bacterium]
MPVERIEIQQREPFNAGASFQDHAYERIDGIAYYAVDPLDESNQCITDLQYAERDSDGLVRFSGDVTILSPVDGGNRAALLEVPNRGHRVANRIINLCELVEDDNIIEPGDGYLFRQGWTLVFCGWQWDVPTGTGRLGLNAPIVPSPESGQMQIRFQPHAQVKELLLTDQHVGSIGNHNAIPPMEVDDPDAVLLVRDGVYAEPTTIPRNRWQFARAGDGEVSYPSNEYVWLEGGFEKGRIYDLIYQPRTCQVVGAGLLALRDMAVYLKEAPFPGNLSHVIGEGVSQCGRFLRTFLYHGLNVNERGQQAFDGMLIHVAGGRRGEFNFRYAQPSVQPTPGVGHLFPYADSRQTDNGGNNKGLLDKQYRRGGVPKIFYTDTAAEYWRGDAGLSHIDFLSGDDVEPPAEVRRYLFSSTQHGSGLLPPIDEGPFGRGANSFNVIDYRPLLRAAVANLLAWVKHDTEPPDSAFPRWQDQTAARRADVIMQLSKQQQIALPDPEQLNQLHPLDLGSAVDEGVGVFPATITGPGIDSPVSAVGKNGNEIAGIPMPDISFPVGVHTGFNPRHESTGGAGQLLQYIGTTKFFAAEEIHRRYESREDYLTSIKEAANDLVSKRFLLQEDVPLCVKLASDRYDAALAKA